MAVRDPRVDGGRADVAVAEVVLDELERSSGIEQVRGDRVPQRVGRQAIGQSGGAPVADEARLDLAAPERPVPAREERRVRPAGDPGEVRTQQLERGGEEHLFAPATALQAPHEQAAAVQVDIPTPQEQHLPHAQAVEVHQREERSVPGVRSGGEEPPRFVLREVAWQLLVGVRLNGQRCEE